MKKSVYLRGVLGTCWYNFTECFAYLALHRKTPDTLKYTPRVKYGTGRQQFLNLCTRRDNENEKKPLFVYIHGGGWVSGITDMRDTYIANWAEKGFFTASIAYTYAPYKVFPKLYRYNKSNFYYYRLIYHQKLHLFQNIHNHQRNLN